MSKSRFGSRAKRAQAGRAAAFSRDIEEHPQALVDTLKAIAEGGYSRSASEAAARIVATGRHVESRLAMLVGQLRYELDRHDAAEAWESVPLDARRRAEAKILPVVDLIRAATAPAGPRVKYAKLDLSSEGIASKQGPWHARDANPVLKAMGVEVPHDRRQVSGPFKAETSYSKRKDLYEVRPGVYVKKL